jgi:RNA polymerase sigma factor (sigma-70 family)
VVGIDEQELIKRVAEGQKDAFPPLVEKYSRLAYTAALRIVRDPFMAEDIAQESFLQAYRSLGSFRQESSFSTWLTRIVVNKSLDHCRRTRHLPSPHDPRVLSNNKAGPDSGPDPEAVFLEKEKKATLREKVMGLPGIYRRVIYQHYFNQQSYKEIALREGVSVKTIESRLYRGKALLRTTAGGGVEGDEMPKA